MIARSTETTGDATSVRSAIPKIIRSLLCSVFLLMPSMTYASGSSSATPIAQWTIFELEFRSAESYKDPLREFSIKTTFHAPSGKTYVTDGFWNGGMTWKVRFSPNELGEWSYQVHASGKLEPTAGASKGQFLCVPYSGKNPLYARGALQVSANRRHLEQASGAPFFWLSDTAWNGPLKASSADWSTYLEDRQRKGFTAIQFVTTQWIAATGNAEGRRAYSMDNGFAIDPTFFQEIDEKIEAINQHGMIAAPVMIWDAPTGKVPASVNPGTSLPDEDLVLLARYELARFGAYQVAWILAGDGNYRGDQAERWRKIGRAVFGDHSDRIVTMHPAGQQWVGEEFAKEPWFSVISYQSGHGDSQDDFRWLTNGPASTGWNSEPVHPIINLEPNYEGHLSYQHQKPFDAHAVRRAAYWSLLISPPAGVAYGAHGIWSWETKPGVPLHHEISGTAPGWRDALQFAGSTDMRYLKDFFETLKWWDLRPAQELLEAQPGERNAAEFVAVALAETEKWGVAYFPVGQTVRIRTNKFGNAAVVRWFNPRNGNWEGKPTAFTGELATPDNLDWVAWVGTPRAH